MKSADTDHRTPDGNSPTSALLLRNPIDFIAEDHLRLRTMCAEMDRLADSSELDHDSKAALSDFLAHELTSLLADEDKDLVPLVLQRAEPEDELPKLICRLEQEHREIMHLLGTVLGTLSDVAGVSTLPNELRAKLRDLASATRRHLILENAVLLPLARIRLTPADLAALRLAMMRRRGLERVFDDGNEVPGAAGE